MSYLLDTSICVYYLRGKFDLNKKIKEKGQENCYISEITVFELRYGAENSDDPLKSHGAVDKFINGLTIVPTFGCEKRYAKEKVRLRKAGTPVHDEFDLLIGVTSVERKMTLVTDNESDFARIEGIGNVLKNSW
jgi:tRNA(fMet)-specific endonuclease VapC